LPSVRRPPRVKLLSVRHILVGVLLGFGGLALLAVRFVLSEMFSRVQWLTSTAPLIIGITLVAFAVIDFILAYSLWVGQRWAWIVSLVFAVLGIVITVPSLFVRPGLGEVVALILYLLVVYCLMQPHVQTFFGGGSVPSTRSTPQSIGHAAGKDPSGRDNPVTVGFYVGRAGRESYSLDFSSYCGTKLT
jgi:lysylphosphatidylglycerol synthetase-like protein (DUF2156 family)